MRIENLNDCIKEAERFIFRAKRARSRIKRETNDSDGCLFFPTKEVAAVRRASMDLTRILTELRRG